MRTLSIAARTLKKRDRYIVCDNTETLQYAGQLGAIELHPWGSRVGALDKPDCMIFDLDPGERTRFSDVVEAALALKKVLDACALPSLVKTSGKRGLHVYVPLKRGPSYDAVRAFAKRVGQYVSQERPSLASVDKNPRKRADKIFIDYLRNAYGQTAVAPYGVRAIDGACVSAPLLWSEVRRGLDPKKFTIKSMRSRVKQKGELWKKALAGGGDLAGATRLLAVLEKARTRG